MFAADTRNMVSMRPDDHVVFVGPRSDVLKWPVPRERGVIQTVVRGGVRVMWERSPLVVAWPQEWLERSEERDR